MYQFGYEECDPLHSFGVATRNHFLFHYILSGKGVLTSTDDREETHDYHLGGGQGFLIWPGQRNTYMADEKDPWTYAWVEFDGLKARELVLRSGLSFNYLVYSALNLEDREKMKNELLYIVHHAESPPLELIGHLYLFIGALINSSSLRKKVTGGSLRDFYVRESLTFIEQHYQDEISVSDIAAFCNLDRGYLGKIFKHVFNESPQKFLIRYRMNKACELMKITNRTISEISDMVGYPNPLNFSRTFSNAMGISPRKWRNENRQG
jgi:AraC-like DNA-binding protein